MVISLTKGRVNEYPKIYHFIIPRHTHPMIKHKTLTEHFLGFPVRNCIAGMLLQAVFDLKPINRFTQSEYKVLARLHIL